MSDVFYTVCLSVVYFILVFCAFDSFFSFCVLSACSLYYLPAFCISYLTFAVCLLKGICQFAFCQKFSVFASCLPTISCIYCLPTICQLLIYFLLFAICDLVSCLFYAFLFFDWCISDVYLLTAHLMDVCLHIYLL